MIRITRLTDYGIVLMSQLAAAPDRHFAAPELAAEAHLPLPMVSKILKQLARAGLLDSHRGAHGGYALSRPAADISVVEIITALEGPIAVTECTDDAPGLCSAEPFCPVSSNWRRINQAIREALGGITLAEMRHPAPLRLVTLGGRGTSAPAM
jgi:FeS assembly SUF system regulator